MADVADPTYESWQNVGDKTASKLAEDVVLEDEWTMWFERKDQEKNGLSEQDYFNSLLNVGSFKTLKGFLTNWDSIHKGDSVGGNVLIFKNGVRPIWEDEYNINGGKWAITIMKGEDEHPLKLWLTLVVAVLSEQLGYTDQICGVVLSLKQWGTSLHVWNRDAEDQEQQEQVRQKLFKLLKVKKVKYVKHRTSLKKNIEVMFPHHDGDKRSKRLAAERISPDRRVSPSRHLSPLRHDLKTGDKSDKDWIAAKEASIKPAEPPKPDPRFAIPAKNPWNIPPKPIPTEAPIVVQKLEPSEPKNAWNISKQPAVPDVVVETVEVSSPVPVVAEPPKPVKNPWNVLPKPTPVPIGVVVEEEVKAEAPKIDTSAKTEAPAQKAEAKVVKSVWAAPPKKADNGADATDAQPRKSSHPESVEAVHKEHRRKNSYQDPAFEEADTTHVSQSSKMTRRVKAEPAPVVWDGKRVIEQASVPPPPQPQERRKSASEITTAPPTKPNKANKTPKSQPLQSTARAALAPVLELDSEEVKSKSATKGDEWQVVDVKPRGRSSTFSGDQPPLPTPASGVAVSEKPQKGTQSRSASAQPTRSISPAHSVLPPVQATTPAVTAAHSEPSPTPAVVQQQQQQQQQQVKHEPAQHHVQAQPQPQKKKKDASKTVTKPKRTTMPTTTQSTSATTQAININTNNNNILSIPQVYIAGGALALVSIVSYYLFM